MSVVERALKRLQTSGAKPAVNRRERIARVAADAGNLDATQTNWKKVIEDAENRAHIEFDLDALGRAGLYSAGNSRLADEYRMIKQPLLKKAAERIDERDSRNGLIVVASALPGEGKTFTSINLALSLAREKDWNVLLVDVDCRNPQLCRLLGADEQPGLLDLLRDDSLTLESHIMATNIDRLFVLPLGGIDDHSTELLASSRMRALCKKLSSSEGRWLVVFDSSPLLLTTESAVLSSQVGQILVVVQANRTPQSAVLEALDKLDGDRSIGLVLNRADQGGEAIGYGTYQAYGYKPT